MFLSELSREAGGVDFPPWGHIGSQDGQKVVDDRLVEVLAGGRHAIPQGAEDDAEHRGGGGPRGQVTPAFRLVDDRLEVVAGRSVWLLGWPYRERGAAEPENAQPFPARPASDPPRGSSPTVASRPAARDPSRR